MNSNNVVINGQRYHQHPNGNKITIFGFGGIFYETEEEMFVAEMLTNMGIHFLHHVNFVFYLKEDDRQSKIWCPDFVFEKPFRWDGPFGYGSVTDGCVIVGLEVKRVHTNGKPRALSRALLERCGIPIMLITRDQILPYYQNGKTLPLLAPKSKQPVT